ncbi:putative aldouronate transport system permease protein [Catenibacillus scindens]|uniref:Putative aldouronate transport system permease protein n=1 Tax=Catenibacillus scindens TaxID=673271 RepID=A0A7W8HE45_9FIRM|nr:ABC transporter permease subunit [Catenibacillus scindens]MBB5266045.1 putative aldouronate transport system permease protein [Catenibacillus scindens]
MRLKKFGKRHRRYIPLYLMMLPGLVYLIINNYIPMAGLIIAFKQVNFRKGILASPWAGLSNFEYLFSSDEAFIITRNTILYNLAFIVLGTIMAVFIAILLNEIRGKLSKKIYQTVILVPYLISMVIVSYLVNALLATETGFVNHTIVGALGGEPISWYSEPKYWPFILILVNLWKNFGYHSIIFYATVVGLDSGLYEAAAIDGANRWQRIYHVTLPGLRSTIITLSLMSIGKIFYSDFGLFYQVPMNSGPLFDVTNTIDTYVYRGLMQSNNIGMSAAAGFYQSVVGCLVVLLANFTVRKISKDDALF